MPNNFYENPNTEEPRPAQPAPSDAPPVPQEVPQNISQGATQESQTAMPNNSNGQLVVSVFTANQFYPVVGAEVSVESESDENRQTFGKSITDRSGRSMIFTLPAPSATASQEPTVLSPFAQYRVTIKHPDFYDAVIENVQIFGGILSQLPVNLIPIPELPNGETTKIVIIPKQNL